MNIPIGALQGEVIDPRAIDTRKCEALATSAAMAAERTLGNRPVVVSSQRGIGYDIRAPPGLMGHCALSRSRDGGRAGDVTLTKQEIQTIYTRASQ